jgi:hypothetical protein
VNTAYFKISEPERNLNLTTIAYKDGIIAYDSLCVKGGTIVDTDYNKHFIKDQYHFFCCGTVSDIDLFISAWKEEDRPENIIPDCETFVWDAKERKLYCSAVDQEENLLWKIELEKEKHYAIGSGHQAALVLMDQGLTAFETITAIVNRDLYTGGKIKTFPIEP